MFHTLNMHICAHKAHKTYNLAFTVLKVSDGGSTLDTITLTWGGWGRNTVSEFYERMEHVCQEKIISNLSID